jgi:hypothetical protein
MFKAQSMPSTVAHAIFFTAVLRITDQEHGQT